MFDNRANQITKPILILVSKILLTYKVQPNHVTFLGLFVGIFCFIFLSIGMIKIALLLFIINRILDGIDGTIARLSRTSDLGGYYDIVFDFIIYSSIPFGFILFDKNNYLSMSFLLVTFLGTCSTFLTTAWIFEKNKITKKRMNSNSKSFYYSIGLIEGTETIIFFLLMFIFYEVAYLFAWVLGFLCIITSVLRILDVRNILKN